LPTASTLTLVPSPQFQAATLTNLASNGHSGEIPFYEQAFSIYNNAPSFVFGEWYETTSDSLFADSVKFANKSGMALYDYPLGLALRDVLGSGNSFTEVDSTLNTENSSFTWSNDLINWVDNQDQPRLLSVDNDNNRLNEALAFDLTARGIPTIYYGDEQYLHNDTGGGGTPYNRLWMSSFSTSTTAYQLISKLSALRTGTNDALAYGTQTQRWMNSDVYIYERQFFGDVVLVAMNKSTSQGYSITGLNTALPAGNYSDYLGGLLSGLRLFDLIVVIVGRERDEETKLFHGNSKAPRGCFSNIHR